MYCTVVSVVLAHLLLGYRYSELIMEQSNAGAQLLGSQVLTLLFAGCVTWGKSGWFDQETYC